MTSKPFNEINPMTSRSVTIPDDDSSDTNFPDNVWMDDADTSSSFLGKIFEKKQEKVEDVFNVVSNRAMLETEVWKTQMAVYDELIAASVAEREEKVKRTIKYEELLVEVEQLKKIRCENEACIENLMKENALMKKNICSLYKTAKAESEQKDKMMLEMNEELSSLRCRNKINSKQENNYVNVHHDKLNGDARNNAACNEAVENKVLKLTSSASRRVNNHTDRHEVKLNDDDRNNKMCNKAVESRITKSKEEKSTSHQSSHKSRDDGNSINYSRKRKRESPYRPSTKYRRSYYDRSKTVEKSPYSYYKRSYGYNGASPRKNTDKRSIKKCVRKSSTSNADSKRETSKLESSKATIRRSDKSKSSGKALANKSLVHEKTENKNSDSKKNAETIIECSDNDLHAKVVDPTSSELFWRQDKMIANVVKDLSQVLNSELPATPSSTPPVITATELHSVPVAITANVLVTSEIFGGEECTPPKAIVAEVPAPQALVNAEKVQAEVSASPQISAAKVIASHLPVATEISITSNNSTKAKNIIPLQNGDSKINANSETNSVGQNVSSSSSSCDLMNNSEHNLNPKNKCFDILEDKTTTNALFFGLLPIEIRRSFMEYEQQLIVNTNRLKQSFVNYYFKHYEGIGPSTHKDEATTADNEPSKEQCSVNRTTSHNKKDVYSPLFFFDEKNKMVMSINSNISPKTLSVNETNNNKLIIPTSDSQAVLTHPSLAPNVKSKCAISENEDVHSDSTKEIDTFRLDEIQKQLEKNIEINKGLSPVLNLHSTIIPETTTMPISLASEITTFPTSVSIEMPFPSVSVSDIEPVPFASNVVNVPEPFASVDAEVPTPFALNAEVSEPSVSVNAEVPTPFASNAAKVSEPSVSVDAEVPTPFASNAAKVSEPSVSDDAEVPMLTESHASVSSKQQTPSVAFVAEIPSPIAANVPDSSVSVTAAMPGTNSYRANSDCSVNHAKQKSPSKLQICYREVNQESYPQYFNSVYSRRQLVKTALKEQEENGLSKSTREDLVKLYKYKTDKKPLVIWRKAKHQKET